MQLDQNGYYHVPPGKIAAVVTLLEILGQRPPPRQVPDDLRLALRRVVQPDLDWYRALYRLVGTDWLWFSRLLMSDEELRTTLWHPAVEIYALSRGGTDLGLLELDGRDLPDSIELAFFGLAPELVGQGAGRWLMERTQDLAWRHAPRRLWVHTCSLDHPAALGFYVRSGFRPYGQAVEIADDPRLSGALPSSAASWLPVIPDRATAANGRGPS